MARFLSFYLRLMNEYSSDAFLLNRNDEYCAYHSKTLIFQYFSPLLLDIQKPLKNKDF